MLYAKSCVQSYYMPMFVLSGFKTVIYVLIFRIIGSNSQLLLINARASTVENFIDCSSVCYLMQLTVHIYILKIQSFLIDS